MTEEEHRGQKNKYPDISSQKSKSFPGRLKFKGYKRKTTIWKARLDTGKTLPDNEGVARCEPGIVMEHGLGWEVGRQGASGAFQEQGDVVGEQLGGLRGEGDGEEPAVAEHLVTQEFL